MGEVAPIGVGIVGLGTVGRRFVEQFQSHHAFELVGGFDVTDAATRSAASDFGLRIFDSAEQLVSDPDIHLVYIATPPLFHEHYVDLVTQAQKTIFCEKPLGVDNAATAAMVARVEASGTSAAVNFVFGAAPSAVTMIDRVRSGDCGQVHSADLRLHFCRWPRDWQAGAAWLRDRDQGGWVREVVSHYAFLLHRLFGPATVVNSTVTYPADGTSEQGLTAVLDFGSTVVRLTGTSDAAGADEVEFTVRGSQRSFRLANWYQLSAAESDGDWTPVLTESEISPAAAYAAQLGQLAALARHEPNSLATLAEAYAVQELVEELLAGPNGTA